LIKPDDPLSQDPLISNPTPVTEVASETENNEPVGKEEKPRDEIVVTKTVEIFEYEQVTNNKVDIQVNNEETSGNTAIIVIIGAIIGVLVLAVIAMLVRVSRKKKSLQTLPPEKLDAVMTGIVEVEPQFVLAADDSKNIFGRPSSAPLNEQIEGSDNKKPSSAQKKRKVKNVFRRVKQDSQLGSTISAVEKASRQNNSDEDDGFHNYDGSPAPRV